MVDVYDHHYLRLCHTQTKPGGPKSQKHRLDNEYWFNPYGHERPVFDEEIFDYTPRWADNHYMADVFFDFWDVRIPAGQVKAIYTNPQDCDFEVRKFVLRLPQRTITGDDKWLNPDNPTMLDIQEEDLVSQFTITSACKPQDLEREHLAKIRDMLLPEHMSSGHLKEDSTPWTARVPRCEYMQEFLRRCKIIVDPKQLPRDNQPEENAHIEAKPKNRRQQNGTKK